MRAKKGKRYCVRVRTGCATCKIRRVKCDEAKPNCLKCTKTGRKCDGYPNTEHRENLPTASHIGQAALVARVPLETSSFYSLPFQIPGSQSDRQLFHYFCVHASTDLAGFSCGSLDFWSKLVPACSFNEPVVRGALIAVASVHRGFASQELPGVKLINSVKEYNKAIRRLRKYMRSEESPNRKVILVCCALFYCFESTRGEHEWALYHLKTALNILKQAITVGEGANAENGNTGIDDLQPIKDFFSRLDIQAAIYEDGQLPRLNLISQDEMSGLKNCVPSSFTSFSTAENLLSKLENWTIHFLISNEQHKFKTQFEMPYIIARELRELKAQFKRWEQVFDIISRNQNPPSDKSRALILQNTISVCKIQLRCYNISLLTFCPMTDADLAKIDHDFQEILDEITNLLRCQASGPSPCLRSFSCESSIVLSLFFISCKCQNARIRHQALSLLSITNRREGIWDAQVLGGVVKGIMDLEMNGARFPANQDGLALDGWAAESFKSMKGGFHSMAKDLNVAIKND